MLWCVIFPKILKQNMIVTTLFLFFNKNKIGHFTR